MQRSVWILCLLLWAELCSAETAQSLAAHPQIQGAIAAIDAWVDGVRDYENVPGVSVGIVADQELLFAKGYGYANLKRKVPADADTIYSICSISKLFTSIGVMQQRDAGKLQLRDPVAKHLDWFDIERAHSLAGEARIQGLLTHSSGLPRESAFRYWMGPDFPFPARAQMIAQLKSQQTLYPADTRFQYSSLGLTLAGEILEHVSGQPYRDYVTRHILEPIGLQDTRPFFPKDLHGKQMAIGYSGLARDRVRKPVAPFDTKAITPAAGFTSTVNDLARFASWQFRLLGDAPGDGKPVLDPNTLREMHRVHWTDPDWKTTWGLGFVVANADGTTVVGHSGGCPGYITSVQLVPKYKLAVIALTNAGDGPANQIVRTMLKTLGPALKAATQPAKPPAEKTAAVVELDDYVGNYSGSVWGGEGAIRIWDKQLVMIPLPSDELKELPKLKHVQGDTFVRLTKDGEEREPWVFQRNQRGAVTGVLVHDQVRERINSRR